jgi:hypothetical protein
MKRALEYEIFVPLKNEKGRAFPATVLAKFKELLTSEFGGLTDTRYAQEGRWQMGTVTLRDEVKIWKIVSDRGDDGDRFIGKIKQDLEAALDQAEILVIRRKIRSF